MTDTAQALLSAFLHAFSLLDINAMLDCFAPEATAFFPVEHQRTRLEDRDAIRIAFDSVLQRVRTAGASCMALVPENLVMQECGDTAVATFHLRGDHLSRRTVVLQRQESGWRIVHLHASNAVLEE
jgi:ketosteroid isomerase-like protein